MSENRTWPSGMELDTAHNELLVPQATERIHLTPEELDGTKMRRISIPEGVGPNDFRNVVAVVWMEYSSHGNLLTDANRIAEIVQLDPGYVAVIMSKTEFITALEVRGVPIAKDMLGLTEKQVAALHILSDPSDGLPLTKKLKKIGVTYTQYRTWLKNPQFRRHINKLAADLINDHEADITTMVVNKALDGDLNAAKYAFELSGKYNPMLEAKRQQTVDIVVILSKMTEVIQRHIKDPATLQAIAGEFRQIAQSANIGPKEIER